MSIERTSGWRVRWRDAGRGSTRRSRTFKRKEDAKVFEAEITRRRSLGELAYLEASRRTLADLAGEWWELYAKPNLAHNTLAGYAPLLDGHILPRLSGLRLREVTPEVLACFRADLEAAGVADTPCASRW